MRKAGLILFLSFFLLGANHLFAQGGKIQGKVRMSDGTELSGVTISIEGTALNTITDKNGDYSLSEVNPGKVTIIASVKGFEEFGFLW